MTQQETERFIDIFLKNNPEYAGAILIKFKKLNNEQVEATKCARLQNIPIQDVKNEDIDIAKLITYVTIQINTII